MLKPIDPEVHAAHLEFLLESIVVATRLRFDGQGWHRMRLWHPVVGVILHSKFGAGQRVILQIRGEFGGEVLRLGELKRG